VRCVKTTQQEPHQIFNARRKPSFGCHGFLSQFQGGDLEAFEQLYNEKYPHLFSLILWKTGSRLEIWEAEGVAQQVFFHVFKKATTYRGKTDSEAWGWIWSTECVNDLRHQN